MTAAAPKEWYSEEIKRLLGEIERLLVGRDTMGSLWATAKDEIASLRAEIERLRALLLRHQVAAWCEEDSDLAVETRAALERQL